MDRFRFITTLSYHNDQEADQGNVLATMPSSPLPKHAGKHVAVVNSPTKRGNVPTVSASG